MANLKLEEFKYNYFVNIDNIKIDDKNFSEKFSHTLYLYLNELSEKYIIDPIIKKRSKLLIENSISRLDRSEQNNTLNDLFLGFAVSFIKKNNELCNNENLKKMIEEIGAIYFKENKKNNKLLGLSFNDFFIMLIPTQFIKSEIKDFIKN